jgi:hypothetical protein
MRQPYLVAAAVLGSAALACSKDSDSISTPTTTTGAAETLALENAKANLEVILRGDGFGLVTFRQPKDDETVVFLDTWVRDLAPNTSYQLQRAVDTQVDDDCTSTAWLTLGRGLDAQLITTDGNGTDREALFRILPPTPGAEFDIHFRVVDAVTQAVALQSECYQFRISL